MIGDFQMRILLTYIIYTSSTVALVVKNIHMEKVWIKTDRKIEKGRIKRAA